MKKQMYAAILAVMMVGIVSCGKYTNQSDNSTAEAAESIEGDNEQDDTGEVEESSTEDIQQGWGSKDTSDAEKFSPGQYTATSEETVLLEQDGYKVTAMPIETTDYGVTIPLEFENNSEDTVQFLSGTIGYDRGFINQYMVDGLYLNTTVYPGKTASDSVNISNEELALYGITEIAEIGLSFQIDNDSKGEENTEPLIIKTSAYDSYDQKSDSFYETFSDNETMNYYGYEIISMAQEELYNDNGIRIVSESLGTNKEGDNCIFLEFVNDGDKLLQGSVSDFKVNGIGISSGTWTTDAVWPDKRRVMTINLSNMASDSAVVKDNLSSISGIEFTFSLKDSECNKVGSEKVISLNLGGGSGVTENTVEVYNEDDIRILSYGLSEDTWDYSDDIHLSLIIENNTSGEIYADMKMDSLSVNGKMTTSLGGFIGTIASGQNSLMDIEIMGSDLKDIGVVKISDIQEVSLQLEFKDSHYNDIASPMITISPES